MEKRGGTRRTGKGGESGARGGVERRGQEVEGGRGRKKGGKRERERRSGEGERTRSRGKERDAEKSEEKRGNRKGKNELQGLFVFPFTEITKGYFTLSPNYLMLVLMNPTERHTSC